MFKGTSQSIETQTHTENPFKYNKDLFDAESDSEGPARNSGKVKG